MVKASRGYCPTEEGVITWTPQSTSKCRFKQGATTTCIVTGKHISCPEANLALINPQQSIYATT